MKRTARLSTIVVMLLGSLLASQLLLPTQGQAHAFARTATLRDAEGEEVGTVKFWRASRSKVLVHVQIDAATPGFHGIHIHSNDQQLGCVPPSFTSVGGHFVPEDGTHGEHRGDFPSVRINEDGTGQLWFVTDVFDMREIVGRAVILHALADNFGNIPTGSEPTSYTPNSAAAVSLTQGTGNAGARIACGVISSH